MAKTEAERVPEPSVESSSSGVHWGAIAAGALGAVGVTIILMALGPGLGLATVSPWSATASAPTTFGIAAGIWLIVTQWLSSGFGGYLAGRLREKWVGIRTDEIFFRDTAHGLLAWALATVIMVVILTVASGVAGTAAVTASTGPLSAEAAEEARKATVAFSFYSSLSLLIGAFIGAVTGALGGYHRDET